MLFAKHLGTDVDFAISDGSILGDLRIYHYKNKPAQSDENNSTQNDIFVFRPLDMEHLFENSFNEGDIVSLNSPD